MPAPYYPSLTTTPWYQDKVAVVVYLACEDIYNGSPRTSWWEGSGVIVDNRRVLTAAHAVRCPVGWREEIRVESPVWGRGRHAWPVALNLEHDAAAIAVDIPYGAAVEVEIAPVEVGQHTCTSVAKPSAVRHCGMIKEISYRAMPQGATVDLEATWFAEGGNSGAGVWDDQGRLVALVTNRQVGTLGGFATSLWGLHLLP